MTELVTPDARYRDSYLAALHEFQAEGQHLDLDPVAIGTDFASYVQSLRDHADPEKVPAHRVPDSHLWLVSGDDYLGRVSIRHRLNETLRLFGGHIGYEIRPSQRRRGYGALALQLALPLARALGLSDVLITCDEDNVGSQRIIERNGGRFENAVTVPGEPQRKLRYWIRLTDAADEMARGAR